MNRHDQRVAAGRTGPRVMGAAMLFSACAVAAAQPVYPNLHNPSESCFEYVAAAAVCVVVAALFKAWTQKDGGGSDRDKRS